MKLFSVKDTLYGKFEDFKVHELNSLEEPRSVVVRFKEDYQAALLYKAINYYYQENVKGTKGHLRSYFSKQKFCYRFVQGSKCRKDHCKFLHYQPDKARYLIDGEVVNHVFDHKLAVDLLRHHCDTIVEVYRSKPAEGDQGFIHPFDVVDRLGIVDGRRSMTDSQEDEYEAKDSRRRLSDGDRSEDCGSRPIEDTGVVDSRKLSDIDQVAQSADREDFSPENASGDEYEEIAWDIANYIRQDEGCIPRMQWEMVQNEEEEEFFALDIAQQNLNYLNDPNEVSDEATAHYYNTSSDSLADDTEAHLHDRGRAWAFDDIDDDIDPAASLSSPITFIANRLKDFKAFCHPYADGSRLTSIDIEPCHQMTAFDDRPADRVEKPVEIDRADEKPTLIDAGMLRESDGLVMVATRSDLTAKVVADAEVDDDEKNAMNMFMSRAQKKKHREAKKKQARKQRMEDVKVGGNQEGSLPSDSIDVSCIDKKMSKCDNSEDENEICKLIEDPISEQFMTAAQSAFERRLEEALDKHAGTAPVINVDDRSADVHESADKDQAENDDADKKTKKKKKKKKKADAKPTPIPAKNKLSGFQEKLMQEQSVQVEKPAKKPESKPEKPQQKPAADRRSFDQDQFDLAQQLYDLSQQDSHSINSLIMLMNKIDSNPSSFRRLSVDTFSCQETCKVYFTPYAK